MKTINSTSDQRVWSETPSDSRGSSSSENSPVRHQYRVLSDEEKQLVSHVKDLGQALLDYLEAFNSRENSIAKTKVEEAIMWAVRGITK
jgi:hypothetical protein